MKAKLYLYINRGDAKPYRTIEFDYLPRVFKLPATPKNKEFELAGTGNNEGIYFLKQ